jgi:hypothetical protein
MAVGYDVLDDYSYKRAPSFKVGNKGDVHTVSFVSYLAFDEIAGLQAAKRKLAPGKVATAIAEARTARAKALGKKVEALEPIDMLDFDSVKFEAFRGLYNPVGNLHYVESRIGLDGAEADKLWKSLDTSGKGQDRQYFCALILVYPIKRDGKIDTRAFAGQVEDGEVEILPWRFGQKNAAALGAVRKGLNAVDQSLTHRDVVVTVEDSQYGTITASPLANVHWRTLAEAQQQAIVEKAFEMYPLLRPFKQISTDELRNVLASADTGDKTETIMRTMEDDAKREAATVARASAMSASELRAMLDAAAIDEDAEPAAQ